MATAATSRDEFGAKQPFDIVIGASGRTRRIIVKDALARGHQVVAIDRRRVARQLESAG